MPGRRQEEDPEPLGIGARLQFFGDRWHLPTLVSAFAQLGSVYLFCTIDMRVHETSHAISPKGLILGKAEIHGSGALRK